MLAAGSRDVRRGDTAHNGNSGFKTAQGPMIDPVVAGASYTPIITVGDRLRGGYMFESIPDGISFTKNGNGTRRHLRQPRDLDRSVPVQRRDRCRLQRLHERARQQAAAERRSGGVLRGEYAIESDENYQRFCSNFLATKAQGFDRPLFFTNEEAIDWVNTRRAPHGPAVIGADGRGRSGPSSRIDARNGKYKPICGMGRHNHENSVAVPGYGKPVVLSGDDTFVSEPGAVAALLVHRRGLERRVEGPGRPVGFRRGRTRCQRLLRLPGRLEHGVTGRS